MTLRSWRLGLGLGALGGAALLSSCGGGGPPDAGAGGSAPGTGGGSAGSGGSVSVGGAPAAGGGAGAGGAWGGSAGGPSSPVTSEAFEVSAHLASDELDGAPTTVGIVTWELAGESPERAHLEFGLSTDYGMVAPVDLEQPDFRTLLLGMKPERTYHFRVVAVVDGATWVSEDQVLETGAATTLVTLGDVTVHDAAGREPGFILSSFWRGDGDKMAFIVDADGEVVWWYDTGLSGGVGQASMSADGASMWMVTASNTAEPVLRVSMDGLTEQRYEDTRGSHAIAPVVDDVMAYVDYGEADCDSLFEIDSAGVVEEIVELSDAEYVGLPDNGGDTTNCHGNAVTYNEAQDVYAFSSYGEDVFIVPRSGGPPTKLSQIVPGGNESWGGIQHGAQVLADTILLFANRSSNNRSSFFEYSAATGDIVASHDPGIFTPNYGDVQRLPGGNTLVTFSNAGVVHEITPGGQLVFELRSAGQRMGYASWRSSLYGPSAETQAN